MTPLESVPTPEGAIDWNNFFVKPAEAEGEYPSLVSWAGGIEQHSATFTREMLDEMIATCIRARYVPCGSRELPHVAHPSMPCLCIRCGWHTPHDEEH